MHIVSFQRASCRRSARHCISGRATGLRRAARHCGLLRCTTACFITLLRAFLYRTARYCIAARGLHIAPCCATSQAAEPYCSVRCRAAGFHRAGFVLRGTTQVVYCQYHTSFGRLWRRKYSFNPWRSWTKPARKGTDTSPLGDSLRLHQSLFRSVLRVCAWVERILASRLGQPKWPKLIAKAPGGCIDAGFSQT